MLYKVVLTFESVEEILKYNHSVVSYGTVGWKFCFLVLLEGSLIRYSLTDRRYTELPLAFH